MDKPRVIFWDIEVGAMIVRTFDLKTDYISPSNIEKDWYVICASYCELDSNRTFTISVLDDPKRFKKNPRDDYYVIKKLRDVLASADILIAQNGDKYDLAKINAKIITYGLPPLPPIKTIDTLKEMRRIGKFSSYSMNYIAKLFGIEQKIPTGDALWRACELGDVKAIKKMILYNRHDVNPMLKQVYLHLKPYMKNEPTSHFVRKPQCPKCGMNSLVIDGHKTKVNGQKTIHYRCKSCYQYSTI